MESLITKTLRVFKEIPNYKYVSFSQLVMKAVGNEETMRIEKEENMFQLLDAFLKEVRKAKIGIKWEFSHGKTVGLPYNIGFCKIDSSKEVRSIALNYLYRCWGMSGVLKRNYVVFSSRKIKYVTKPLDEPSQKNPLIEITIDPLARYNDFDFDAEDNYAYVDEFEKACSLVSSLVNVEDRIYDAIGASVVVTYLDGHKETFKNQYNGYNECFDFICELAKKYTPDILKNKIEEE